MLDETMQKPPVISQAEFDAFANGDHKVFEKIFGAYVGLVQFVVGKFGLQAEVRDDLVQEVFVKLHENRSKIAGAGTIKSWLCVTARNLSIDHIRRKQPVSVEDHPHSAQLAASAPTPEGMIREAEVQMVAEVIKKVVADTGDDTLQLFYVEGISAKDIAVMKNEAVSTVTTRLSRLRKKFRDGLKQHIEELRATFPGEDQYG